MGMQDRDWYREIYRERRLAEQRRFHWPMKKPANLVRSAGLFVLLCAGVYAVLSIISFVAA